MTDQPAPDKAAEAAADDICSFRGQAGKGLIVATIREAYAPLQVEVEGLRVCADELCDLLPGTSARELPAKIKHLRTRLREQTDQTRKTGDLIRDAVLATLRHHDAIPDTIDPLGHPIEQVVGTCLSVLKAEKEKLQAEVAGYKNGLDAMSQAYADKAIEVSKLQTEVEGLREALTPSGDTKAAYIGEVKQPSGHDDGEQVTIEWTATKDIMGLIRKRAAEAAQTQGGETDAD